MYLLINQKSFFPIYLFTILPQSVKSEFFIFVEDVKINVSPHFNVANIIVKTKMLEAKYEY